MKILVINQNENSRFLPHAEQFKVFDKWQDAVTEAKRVGWEDPFGMGVDKTSGIANIYHCGDVNVMIMAVEEQ